MTASWQKMTTIRDLLWRQFTVEGATGIFRRTLSSDTAEAAEGQSSGSTSGTILRFDKGGRYPAFRLVEGSVEIVVLAGAIEVNDRELAEGDWARFMGLGPWKLAATSGAQVLIVVRGKTDLVATAPSGSANGEIEVVRPAELPWVPSPTGAPGCASKKVWRYGTGTELGRDRWSDAYSCLYSFDRLARYPHYRVASGRCDLGITEGAVSVNDLFFVAGDWIRLEEGTLVRIVGVEPAVLIGIVDGRLELV